MQLLWRVSALPTTTSLLAIDVRIKLSTDQLRSGFRECSIESYTDFSVPAGFDFELLLKGHDIVRLLLPTVDGFLNQSDFLSRRLVDCRSVSSVHMFKTLESPLRGIRADACDTLDFAGAVDHAIGALVVPCPGDAWPESELAILDQELTNRLSFEWHAATTVPKRYLAVIRPGPVSTPLSLAKVQDLVDAATSLNVSLIMFDDPCHGLGDGRWSHLGHTFVPMDMTLTDDMAHYIVSVISAYPRPVDGILAFYEALVPVVADAAVLLNLPTHSLAAVDAARDKYKTRQNAPGLFCECVRSVEDLDAFLARYRTIAPLPFSLIVKPASGWASTGVSKVSDEADLRTAVTKLWQPPYTSKYGHDAQGPVLIEPYVSGPEIDVNVILVDGELLFFEVNDDYPSGGDYDDRHGFVETATAMPSLLPQSEIFAIRDKAHATLLSMGFRTGIFNVEARVHNSTLEYTTEQDGVFELAPRPHKLTEIENPAPTVFIIEVNPRSPGPHTCILAGRAYGLSYRSLSLLTAVADTKRLRALSSPFIGGAQYHVQMLWISAHKGGIYRSGDLCAQVFERDREIRSYVVECMGLLRDGQEVPDPRTGSSTEVACFCVYSRKGRKEVRTVGEKIRKLVSSITGGL